MRVGFFFLPFFMPFFIIKNAMQNRHKISTLSVPSPLNLGRNTTLFYLDVCNQLPSVRELVGSVDNSEMVLYPGVRACIQLVLMNHMRVSECLDIFAKDEIRPSLFLVRAKKNGFNYTIHIPIDGRNRKILSSMLPCTRLFPFSYHFVWYSMVKAGMGLSVSTRVNRVVTHRGRYDLAEKLVQLNEKENITPLLHHKSKKSKFFYLPKGAK